MESPICIGGWYRSRITAFLRASAAVIAVLAAFLFFSEASYGAQISISWNASADPSAIGYKVYYGTASRDYQWVEDVGANLSYTLTGLSATQVYYIALTVYGASSESGYSQELACYFITSATPSNGQITPSGDVPAATGSSSTFSIAPDSGYATSDVLIDGVSIGAVSQYTFSNISACHSISASFAVPSSSYKIHSTASGKGTISPSGNVTVASGGSETFTMTPGANAVITNVKVDGNSVGTVSSYTFTDVTSNHTIAATFARLAAWTISAAVRGGGEISPSGNVSVLTGNSQTFTVSPKGCHILKNVLVDGNPAGPVSSYTFTNVSAGHTITAVFSKPPPPVADPGPDQIVNEGSVVTLNGSNSTDDVMGITSWTWAQVSGPSVVLSNPSTPVCTFSAPEVANGRLLVFRLQVTNKGGVTSGASCLVNVSANDDPPLANAGSGRTAPPAAVINLNGSASSDPNSDIASYNWCQTRGPAVQIMNADSSRAFFSAPEPGPGGASLVFKLLVTDRWGLRTRDQCIVNVAGSHPPPVASAGADQTAAAASSVTLSGSGSKDPSGSAITCRWKQVMGTPVTLSNPEAEAPVFTVPAATGSENDQLVFRLTVTNVYGLSTLDKCTVSVAP